MQLMDADEYLYKLNERFGTLDTLNEFKSEFAEY